MSGKIDLVKSKLFTKVTTNCILTTLASFSLVSSCHQAHAGDLISTSSNAVTTTLKSADVLQSDIAPRLELLNAFSKQMQKYPDYVNSRDYLDLRTSFRQSPGMFLRKTCTQLIKYLPGDKSKLFGHAYRDVIDSINDLDDVRKQILAYA